MGMQEGGVGMQEGTVRRETQNSSSGEVHAGGEDVETQEGEVGTEGLISANHSLGKTEWMLSSAVRTPSSNSTEPLMEMLTSMTLYRQLLLPSVALEYTGDAITL